MYVIKRTLRSVTNLTRKDAREFLDIAADIFVKIDVETYTVEEANNVLKKLKDSNINGTAVLKIK